MRERERGKVRERERVKGLNYTICHMSCDRKYMFAGSFRLTDTQDDRNMQALSYSTNLASCVDLQVLSLEFANKNTQPTSFIMRSYSFINCFTYSHYAHTFWFTQSCTDIGVIVHNKKAIFCREEIELLACSHMRQNCVSTCYG